VGTTNQCDQTIGFSLSYFDLSGITKDIIQNVGCFFLIVSTKSNLSRCWHMSKRSTNRSTRVSLLRIRTITLSILDLDSLLFFDHNFVVSISMIEEQKINDVSFSL